MKPNTRTLITVLISFILLQNSVLSSPIGFFETYQEARKHNYVPATYDFGGNKYYPGQGNYFANPFA